jgi:glycyl-tRNA synthetase beta chain
VSNIVEKEKQKVFDPALCVLPAEKKLSEAYTKSVTVFDASVKAKKYAEAGQALSILIEPITGFFTDVLVMDKDENIKNNRVGLLKSIDQLFKKTANFKKIVL